ncbi:MAG: hypothetical protein JWP34_4766, partial [Massilia sp.]|nr:hypothetical protein [Massilia sp.]
PAAGCQHPVRLFGDLHTIDTRTGQILATTPTTALPDGIIYKACGNRRATICPSCAETYRRDAYHLVRSGLAGGKTVPETVAGHPAVFATFTAPGFGPVHTRHVTRHAAACTDPKTCACRPDPCHARTGPTAPDCPHGAQLVCFTRHLPGDPALGQPLCADCYDHDHHVVWNNQTGELWRRTKQNIERHLNRLARRRGLSRVRVSHGKAAEDQARAAIHFHVLLRLDSIDPDDPDQIIPPPAGFTVADLDEAVHRAATITAHTTADHPTHPGGWPIRWGRKTDVRPIALRADNPVTDAMVAAYLAKYATKGTEITGHTSRRITTDTMASTYGNPDGTHTQRLVEACWRLGEHPDYEGLRRWAHMLGFGGHFLTKARRYSITFTALRAARATYRRTQDTGPEHHPSRIHRQDHPDEETTLIIGSLTYAGTGWKTTGDALLANTAADQARKRRAIGREELAHQYALDGPQEMNAA